ncbi:MAG: hypothetical protein SFU99_24275 [Saprospiraceae bacterium]|nr:hypothetical protein [Saprospiraceae bacterium]
MKSFFMAVALWLLAILSAQACDVCGCSIGGNYFGILPQFHGHFVGLRYQYRSFRSEHLPLFSQTETLVSHEYFHTTELWGRWNPSKKLQLFAFVPVHFMQKRETGISTRENGIGDPSVIANLVLFNTGDDVRNTWKHAIQIGAGIKFPVGHSNLKLSDGLVNPNFQLGTGSFDFPLNAIYTIRYKRAGLSTEVNYRINTANSNDYRFGNRLNTGTHFFYWQQVGATAFLPSVGTLWEYAAQDLENGIYQDLTGGQSLWLTTGLDVYFQRFSVGMSYQQALYQDLAEGQLTSRPRLTANVSFLF